jgi:hypothetical protein
MQKKLTIRLKSDVPCDVKIDSQPTSVNSIPKRKKCNKCGIEKSFEEYYKSYGKCKDCVKAEQRERNKKTSEENKKRIMDPQSKSTYQYCYKCEQDKPLSEFRVGRSQCLECEREYGRTYNQENSEIRQKWVDEHRERMTELQANWYQNNKSHIRAKFNSRYSEDNCFKIKQLLKCHLQHRIRKISSTEDYTGTDFEQVADWFEYNFTPEMNWGNHGTMWDIDHVIPVALWNLDDPLQVDMCFNWKNLSPLFSSKNRHEKSDTLDHEQIIRHKAQLKKYFEENHLDMKELVLYMVRYDQQLILLGETP